jgi:hypothetical protein
MELVALGITGADGGEKLYSQEVRGESPALIAAVDHRY